ncbi:MAG: TetR/AcrR family transcriptional regulator [Pseudomonadota bacterium]
MVTATQKDQTAPRRGAETRAAILAATREELVEHGWRKFSVDKVSRRAKSSKQTIYRWWPAIATMCLDSLLELIPAANLRSSDPVERIAALLAPLEQTIRASSGHAVFRAAMLAASDDDKAWEVWRAWLKDHVRTPLRLALAEVAAKNQIRRDFDIDEAMDTLLGPLWTRVVVLRAPLPEGFAAQQATAVLRQQAP